MKKNKFNAYINENDYYILKQMQLMPQFRHLKTIGDVIHEILNYYVEAQKWQKMFEVLKK